MLYVAGDLPVFSVTGTGRHIISAFEDELEQAML